MNGLKRYFPIAQWLPHYGRDVLTSDLLAALIVAWGRLFESAGARIFAMGLCVLMLLGEPSAMAVINLATQPGDGVLWQMKVSPIQLIWRMTRPFGGGATFTSTAADQFGPQVAAVTAAAVLGWVMYALRPKAKPAQVNVPDPIDTQRPLCPETSTMQESDSQT